MPEWNGKRISKEELDAKFKFFESPEVQAKIKEGFDQIERGEYVSYPLDEAQAEDQETEDCEEQVRGLVI